MKMEKFLPHHIYIEVTYYLFKVHYNFLLIHHFWYFLFFFCLLLSRIWWPEIGSSGGLACFCFLNIFLSFQCSFHVQIFVGFNPLIMRMSSWRVSTEVHEFNGAFLGYQVQCKVTSVIGHVFSFFSFKSIIEFYLYCFTQLYMVFKSCKKWWYRFLCGQLYQTISSPWAHGCHAILFHVYIRNSK